MRRALWISAICLPLIALGCETEHHDDPCPDGGASHVDGGHDTHERHEYGVFMEAGHIHAWREVAITFTVRDMEGCDETMPETCPAIAGLVPSVFWRGVDATRTREQAVEPGVLDDNGDGTYTWIHTFSETGSYAVGLSFLSSEQYYSAAFPLEVSKAGGERIFCPNATAPDFGYQIRWEIDPGHVHATETGTETTISVELMRSFGPVNTEMPWTNTFNHLRPDELTSGVLQIELTDDAGAVIDTVDAIYQGRGIYRATRTFTEADLDAGAEREVRLHVTFTDDQGCSADETGEDYAFRIVPGH